MNEYRSLYQWHELWLRLIHLFCLLRVRSVQCYWWMDLLWPKDNSFDDCTTDFPLKLHPPKMNSLQNIATYFRFEKQTLLVLFDTFSWRNNFWASPESHMKIVHSTQPFSHLCFHQWFQSPSAEPFHHFYMETIPPFSYYYFDPKFFQVNNTNEYMCPRCMDIHASILAKKREPFHWYGNNLFQHIDLGRIKHYWILLNHPLHVFHQLY